MQPLATVGLMLQLSLGTGEGHQFLLFLKEWKPFIPIQAEAEAINWATLQVLSDVIESVFVKSDAKICVDALSNPPWRISALTQDTLRLKS